MIIKILKDDIGMIFNQKHWMILLLGVSILPYDAYPSSQKDEDISISSPVSKKPQKRLHTAEDLDQERKIKKPRPSLATDLKLNQSQTYAIPTYNGTFKYLMNDPQICQSFLRSFIPDQEIKSIKILDDHLSPFKKYQRARTFVNDTNSKSVIDKMKNLLEEKEVKKNNFYISFENTQKNETNKIQGGEKFLKELVSIYGDILKGYPLPQRNSQVDLLCEVDEDYYALVEVQVIRQDFWDKRALFYAASIYANQMNEGESLKNIKKVICINLLGGGPKDIKWSQQNFKRFTVKDQHNHEIEEGIEIRQYPLFHPEIRQDKAVMKQLKKEGKKEYLEWLDFFESAHRKKEEDMQKIESDGVKQAYNRIKVSKLPTDVKKENLEQDEEVFADYSQYTKHLQNQAREEGLQEGIEKGIEEGIEKGLEKGKSETSINIALNLFKIGLTEDQISEATGLSPSDLTEIKEKNPKREIVITDS